MTGLAQIVAVLERELGLDVASVGTRAIEAAIARRRGDDNIVHYANEVATSPTELAALIDELVVPETWFFRDSAPFRLIAQRASAFAAAQPLRPFRVLSVPCASGEEPYSAAIAMLEAGLRPTQFAISACDISSRNIETARAGTYGKGSFRGSPPFGLAKYLEPAAGKQAVIGKVRQTVRFARHNVLDDNFLGDEPRFDVILCRNLLIYLTAAARAKVVGVLDRYLHDDGIVIVGHAEALDRLDPRFRPTSDTGAFAFQRGVAPATPAPVWIPPPPAPLRIPEIHDDERETTQRQPILKPSEATLEVATALADRGELDAALAMCEHLVTYGPPNAACYTLMGIVQHSRHNAVAAERAFTQALYVDPQHREALVHLSLLLRQRGQVAAADQLIKRAEKVPR